MQLLQVQNPRSTRYYLDGVRISQDTARDLKASRDQDSFKTEISGDTVRQYSSLRKRTR